MKYYKNSSNVIFAYESDGSQDNLIAADLISITESEAQQLLASQQTQRINDIQSTWTYADKRRAEYPDFRDYLDGLVKNDQAQINKYLADCAAVKAKYPKPE